MAVRIIKGSWWVDFRADHTRYRKRSPENSRAAAKEYEAVLRRKLARGEPIDGVAQKDTLFEEFAWQWFETYAVSNKFSEQRAKKSILALSLVPFFGKLPVRKITTHQIEQFKARLVKQGYAPQTVRNRLTVLYKCLGCAREWLQLESPVPKVKWPKCPSPRTDFLSAEECDLLLKHAEGVMYEIILTALRTGMRQGELKGLQWSSIDWQNRSVTVRHSYDDARRMLDTPKSNRDRHIPLDTDVYEMLFKRKQSTGYVFVDMDNNKPFNSPRLNNRLAKMCGKAGLRRITAHTLRHTFASQLAMKGIPLNLVQALLGHASITTTMRYSHFAPSSLRSAIEMLNPKTAFRENFGQPVGNQWMESQKTQQLQPISGGR